MGILDEILSSRVRAEIFRLLFGPEEVELHQRELARRSGLAIRAVQLELEKLTRLELVQTRRDGNRLYYRANRDHPLYGNIQNLILKTAGLIDVLRDALGKGGIKIAFVFGSIARGQVGAAGDVDLLIIGNLTLREVSKRLQGVTEKVGREINPHVLSPEEFRNRVQHRDHFLNRVLESPKLFVVGSENELKAMG